MTNSPRDDDGDDAPPPPLPLTACERSCRFGSWPLWEAVEKSLASCVNCPAALVFPCDCAVCAAVCRLVEICWVTCVYLVGFDCCSCCKVLASCAKGESWLLSDCCAVDLALLVLLEF